MFKVIKLHWQEDGGPFYLNVDDIVRFYHLAGGSFVSIARGEKGGETVKETVEEILHMTEAVCCSAEGSTQYLSPNPNSRPPPFTDFFLEGNDPSRIPED